MPCNLLKKMIFLTASYTKPGLNSAADGKMLIKPATNKFNTNTLAK